MEVGEEVDDAVEIEGMDVGPLVEVSLCWPLEVSLTLLLSGFSDFTYEVFSLEFSRLNM